MCLNRRENKKSDHHALNIYNVEKIKSYGLSRTD